ncbi:MAG TPA: hypothetical protein DIT40_03620 [Alphaproteobacteria bacterium]|nr:hypothetical protein [Alphaproteobacteria bacterium]
MRLGKILVPLAGTDSDQRALRAGFDIAANYGAHVACLFVNRNPTEALPVAGEALTGQIATELVAAVDEANKRQCAKARETFLHMLAQTGAEETGTPDSREKVTAEFLETMGDPADRAAAAARLADLVIFSVPDIAYDIEPTLMESGRPCLLVPGEAANTIGQRVIVAWDGGPEAARALTGALPLLGEAESVTFITAQDREFDELATAALQSYIGSHGIKATIKQVALGNTPVGEVILNQVKENQADLLVMGAYGHSRIRELILGGATRYVIQNTDVAVLMVH